MAAGAERADRVPGVAVIEVFLASATICFSGSCYPALVGSTTPRGVFEARHQVTPFKGYGGDILNFAETRTEIFAIHRTWRGREKLYERPNVERARVTRGCINVEPHVYEALVACCAGGKVVIK